MAEYQLIHDQSHPFHTFSSIILQEPHAAVAKPIESFTHVVQAVSPKKEDSYDEDSYDIDSYDSEDDEDEELEAVGVARRGKRSRKRKLH